MKPFFVAFFFMLISQFGHAQADAIDTFLQDQMAKQNIVGLSVGIIKNGEIVKAKGYGYANLENSMPASENTVYKLAPVSKHIIATAIMQFVQEGRLALNDPVGKFFRDTPPHWKEITIKHLLNHTSGLQRESPTFEQMVQKPDSILIKASYSEHNKIVSIAEGLSDIVFANEPPKDDYSSKIDSLIRAKNPRVFNGIVWITKKGDTKYLKTSGYSNLETKTPFTLKDNFRIQSNSKQITAVLILREVEKGKIALHAPIRKYLPDFKQTWADTVTVHQLLNNTAGIVDIAKPLAFRPGTDYYYSNPGYGLLRPILEKVTGKTLIEVANNLFKELKMDNSYCYELDKPNPGLVNGYWVSKDSVTLFHFKNLNHTIETWANFIPAGGMISNAIDLNTWDQKLHHGKILQAESYKLMTTYDITAQHDSFGHQKVGYGYGIRISDKTPVSYLGHSGKGIGFMSMKFYIPAKDVDVIVLQNYYDVDSKLHYYYESKIREIVINSSLAKF